MTVSLRFLRNAHKTYIEALLHDEVLTVQVWSMWNARVIDDELAVVAS